MAAGDTKAIVDASIVTIYTLLVDFNNSFLRNGLALLLVVSNVRPCDLEIPPTVYEASDQTDTLDLSNS